MAGGTIDSQQIRPRGLHCPEDSNLGTPRRRRSNSSFLLNPAFQNVDLSSEKMSPYRDELMQDFEEVCMRLLVDVDKAAQALADFQKYKDAGYFSLLKQSGVKKVPSYKFWDAYCADLPTLGYVARRVLSKQVGVGAVERSHKGMKYTVFSKDRNQMSPAKADRDLYTLLNTRALQRVDSSLAEQVPDWVTLYSEDLESPVAAEPALLLENQGDAAAAAGAM